MQNWQPRPYGPLPGKAIDNHIRLFHLSCDRRPIVPWLQLRGLIGNALKKMRVGAGTPNSLSTAEPPDYSMLKTSRVIEILNHPGLLCRTPPQPLLRQHA